MFFAVLSLYVCIFFRFPYSAQEQQNVKEDFLRTTGFPMSSHPDCAHSDSLGSPLQYSTCPCAVGSGGMLKGRWRCLDASGGSIPQTGLPGHPSLFCATQHLWKPWHRASRRRNAHGPRLPPSHPGWLEHAHLCAKKKTGAEE